LDFRDKSPEEFFSSHPVTARLGGESTKRRREDEIERKINDTSL